MRKPFAFFLVILVSGCICCGDSSEDASYYEEVEVLKDCEEMDGAYAMICHARAGVKYGDAAECRKVANEDFKNICLATALDDIGYCGKVSGKTDRTYCEAHYNGDPAECDRISISEHRDNCLKMIGILRDSRACNGIRDESIKASCQEIAEVLE